MSSGNSTRPPSASVAEFLLQLELPENALQRANDSLQLETSHPNKACQIKRDCPHWQHVLPSQLDLTFRGGMVDDEDKSKIKWILRHPVHALHLQSQLADDIDCAEPILFGEEQERLMALKMEGIPESWHPWINETHPSTLIHNRRAAFSPNPATIVSSTSSNKTKVASPSIALPAMHKLIATATPSSEKVPSTASLNPTTSQTAASTSAPLSSSPSTSSPLSLPSPSTAASHTGTIRSMLPAPVLYRPPSIGSIASGTNPAMPPPAPQTSATSSPITAPLRPSTSSTVQSSQTGTHVNLQGDVQSTPQAQPEQQLSYSPAEEHLLESTYAILHTTEEQIRVLRRAFLSKRNFIAPIVTASCKKNHKKRKTDNIAPASVKSSNSGSSPSTAANAVHHHTSLTQMAAWNYGQPPPEPSLSFEKFRDYYKQQQQADRTVALWMEKYRWNRQSYWMNKNKTKPFPQHKHPTWQSPLRPTSVFGATPLQHRAVAPISASVRDCQWCGDKEVPVICDTLVDDWMKSPNPNDWKNHDHDSINGESSHSASDNYFQCLECSFIGCAPSTIDNITSSQHILLHLVQSNHNYAVSCGSEARIYCFQCGDFVSHKIFEQEKVRIDLTERLPWQAWKEHSVKRSFDAMRFFRVQDQGVFWRGMHAMYPVLVPPEHVQAAQACRLRQIMWQGELEMLPITASRDAIQFTARQHGIAPKERWRIQAPIGMYNLGNTCFMSAILQCLIHCAPLQRYFLNDVGHNHESCAMYRNKKASLGETSRSKRPSEHVCLACEMDKIFLRYTSKTIGVDLLAAVSSTKRFGKVRPIAQGDPLVIADMLTAAWKCGGMKHLAGYEQRDAHEFLHGFLEILGRHTQQYRMKMYRSINTARPSNSFLDIHAKHPSQFDAIKGLFEGTLRSILVCSDCGSKRIQSEPFMSILLPLSKAAAAGVKEKPSLEFCLRQFTSPEMLADPVDCPSCGKKTPTKQQHVVSKLPKILCIHIKRFDAAQNKKIEDFVAFPSQGLNMGLYLPHWREVERVPLYVSREIENEADEVMPEVLYDLFGTVNHFGNLQSGHYVTNVKVKDKWFHINDAFVAYAGLGSGEAEVLKSEGAYVLFYAMR